MMCITTQLEQSDINVGYKDMLSVAGKSSRKVKLTESNILNVMKIQWAIVLSSSGFYSQNFTVSKI